MKKNIISHVLLFVMCLAYPVIGKAQTFSGHFNVGMSMYYQRGLSATVAYEFEKKYRHSYEFYGTYYLKYEEDPSVGHITSDSFWKSYNTWEIGVAYKPCVFRGHNAHGNMRLGGGVGSSIERGEDNGLFSDILGGLHVGYEHSYILRHGWNFYWQVNADVLINGKDTFRPGVTLGVKIPSSRR